MSPMRVLYAIFFFVAVTFTLYLLTMYEVGNIEPQASSVFDNVTQNVSATPAEMTMALGTISFLARVGLAVVFLTMAVYVISELVMK
ncbi:hypothetical protein [Thermococcus sp.]|uniref:hypothetical protein n=2 Tax=Thermococcus sp. TaxID=35749 RepID=UPI002610C11A|nr:hypothetical protein [Thermococcus sp.]